ncbi:MAG: hypothetical protein U9N86_03825 [Bacteroidota bacterium]|nr:hypothetical protein [Bacteroidota bacterium]
MRIEYVIKSSLSSLRILSLLLMMAYLLACIKVDTPPSLEITVLDQYNNPVEEVLVTIFDSQEEWAMRENPLQAWKMTDGNGKVMFVNLQETNYFIYAEKGKLNNLKNEIKTADNLLNNQIRLIRIHVD